MVNLFPKTQLMRGPFDSFGAVGDDVAGKRDSGWYLLPGIPLKINTFFSISGDKVMLIS